MQIYPESLTRPSAPAMVGGRCQDDHQQGRVVELFSSEVSSLSSEVLPKESSVTSLDRGGGEDLKILKISHTWLADKVCGGPDRVGHLS